MGILEFIVAIVAVSAAGKVLQAYFVAQQARYQNGPLPSARPGYNAEAFHSLREEVRALHAELAEVKRTGGRTAQAGGANLSARVQAIEEEVANLRDTTTQFDMSFDAALDRVERRMDRMESAAPPVTGTALGVDTNQTQYVGRR